MFPVVSLSWLFSVLALGWVGLFSTGAWAAEPLPAGAESKITAETWEKLAGGQTRDVLVLYNHESVEQTLDADSRQRRLAKDDALTLARRADGYRAIKDRLRPMGQKGEIEVRRDYSHLPMSLVRVRDLAALRDLLANPNVEAVLEDKKLQLLLTQSLPLIGQPPVKNVMGLDGAGTTVVVLDTGVNYTNTAFGPCTAPGTPANCKVVVALDMATDDGALDDNGHGTRVAAVVVGTAPGARIAALDVFGTEGASSSDIIAGINWAIASRDQYNIVAVNMSLGDGQRYTEACSIRRENPYRQPLINARNAGILAAVSSGNNGYTDGISAPACTPEALSVGAVYDANVGAVTYSGCSDSSSATDQVTCFSNGANYLSLLAPGAIITAGGGSGSGTSFASPFVSAAIAVLAQAYPSDSANTRASRLIDDGHPVVDHRNGLTFPRIDLLAAQGSPDNDPFAAARVASGESGQDSGWNWNASKENGEPEHAGNSGGASVWWQWTASESGTLTLDTHGSGLDTVLAVYTGTDLASLTSIGGNDDDGVAGGVSGLTLSCAAGQTYHIAVDGKNGGTGDIQLNWQFAPPPPVADLGITLVDAPDPVLQGQTLRYTLTVTNAGPDTATEVVATMALPSGADLISGDPACAQDSGNVTCGPASLASGQQLAYLIDVSPTQTGTLSAQASVSADTQDPELANNFAATLTQVVANGGGVEGEDTDVPVPAWALLLLAAGLGLSLGARVNSRH